MGTHPIVPIKKTANIEHGYCNADRRWHSICSFAEVDRTASCTMRAFAPIIHPWAGTDVAHCCAHTDTS
eukprot:5205969-Pyramimonas_sp.AAC.1